MDRRILGVLFILSFFLWIGSAFWFCSHARGSMETPHYLPVERQAKFEIRDYSALQWVRTSLDPATPNATVGAGYRRLAAYLNGANDRSQRIPLTTPVLIDLGGAASATAPARTPSIAFILPKAVAAAGAPAPSDPAVTLEAQPLGRFAVLRYSGGRDAVTEGRAAERLDAWLQSRHWVAEAGPLFAYYDPSWVPTFFRRNEVWVRVHGGTAPAP